MDVRHYRPGRVSATEEVAVDGHHQGRCRGTDRLVPERSSLVRKRILSWFGQQTSPGVR
jgi:hypothetical protein